MSIFPRPDFAALARYDPERGSVTLDLSDNTNLWGTHPDALARVRGADADDLARYPELYADVLREAVATRFGVRPECVTTGAGSDDVLDSAFRAVFTPGATMSFAAPTFSMIEAFAAMNALEPVAVSWRDAERDPSALLAGRPSLVYVCRPNNPTGAMSSRAWLDDLLEARGERGPLVVVDEAYADFAGETLASHAPEVPRLLVARTASKAFGLAGLRCGFAVGAPEVVLEVDKARGPYKVGRLAAEATAAALLDEAGWMDGVLAECVANRERLDSELAQRGFEALPSSTNFILFAAPSGDGRSDAGALRAEGIGVRPFSEIPELGDGLRVTVGPWPMMQAFLTALDAAFPAGREVDS